MKSQKNPKSKQAKAGGKKGNKNAEKWTEKKLVEIGNGLIEWLKEKSTNVFVDEYLLYEHDFDPGNLSRYTKKHDSFEELIKKAKSIQELKLRKYASKMSVPMAIFCLKNNHGYKDKQDITTNDENLHVPVEIIVTTKSIDQRKSDKNSGQ